MDKKEFPKWVLIPVALVIATIIGVIVHLQLSPDDTPTTSSTPTNYSTLGSGDGDSTPTNNSTENTSGDGDDNNNGDNGGKVNNSTAYNSAKCIGEQYSILNKNIRASENFTNFEIVSSCGNMSNEVLAKLTASEDILFENTPSTNAGLQDIQELGLNGNKYKYRVSWTDNSHADLTINAETGEIIDYQFSK